MRIAFKDLLRILKSYLLIVACIDFNGFAPGSVVFIALVFVPFIHLYSRLILWIAEAALQIIFENFAVSGHIPLLVKSLQSSLKVLRLLRYQIHFGV